MSARLYACCAIYTNPRHPVEPARFPSLLQHIRRAVGDLALTHYFSMSVAGGIGRMNALSAMSVIPGLWSRAKTAEFSVHSHDRIEREDEYGSFSLERDPRLYVRGSTVNFLNRITILRTISETDLEIFIASLKAIFNELHGTSGYIHVTSEMSFAFAELGFTAMREPWTEGDFAFHTRRHEEDTNERVNALGRIRSQVGPRLRGAYWGSFLGSELVDQLGGIERVLAEAPVAIGERLEFDGAYLQLTRRLETVVHEQMERALPELERYLTPIIAGGVLLFNRKQA